MKKHQQRMKLSSAQGEPEEVDPLAKDSSELIEEDRKDLQESSRSPKAQSKVRHPRSARGL